MSASDATTTTTRLPTPVVNPETVAATPWRDRGWTDAGVGALFGGPSYHGPETWWSRREVRP